MRKAVPLAYFSPNLAHVPINTVRYQKHMLLGRSEIPITIINTIGDVDWATIPYVRSHHSDQGNVKRSACSSPHDFQARESRNIFKLNLRYRWRQRRRTAFRYAFSDGEYEWEKLSIRKVFQWRQTDDESLVHWTSSSAELVYWSQTRSSDRRSLITHWLFSPSCGLCVRFVLVVICVTTIRRRVKQK